MIVSLYEVFQCERMITHWHSRFITDNWAHAPNPLLASTPDDGPTAKKSAPRLVHQNTSLDALDVAATASPKVEPVVFNPFEEGIFMHNVI